MHILLVEDDLDLGPALLAALKAEGMSVQWVRRVADARNALGPEVDMVLLDRALADQDGLDLLRQWRARRIATPVIVITARSALTDRLEGLDQGADDYLVKPFEIPELLSRVRAVHRRHRRQAGEMWHLNGLTVSPHSHQAWLDGEAVPLSAREFQLLMALAKEAGTVVPKQVLGQLLEPLGDPVDAATIEVHVSNLRRKIGAERIRTVRGVGYQLRTC
ncbi:response regulator [Zoogloea sp.]|uniref:response regulator n=1 Tax=Zoogloea sp. TaxID=49181 RepID=UPI0035AF54EC